MLRGVRDKTRTTIPASSLVNYSRDEPTRRQCKSFDGPAKYRLIDFSSTVTYQRSCRPIWYEFVVSWYSSMVWLSLHKTITEQKNIHWRWAEYTTRNVETIHRLFFRANTPTKEIYTWLYLQVYYLFIGSSFICTLCQLVYHRIRRKPSQNCVPVTC